MAGSGRNPGAGDGAVLSGIATGSVFHSFRGIFLGLVRAGAGRAALRRHGGHHVVGGPADRVVPHRRRAGRRVSEALLPRRRDTRDDRGRVQHDVAHAAAAGRRAERLSHRAFHAHHEPAQRAAALARCAGARPHHAARDAARCALRAASPDGIARHGRHDAARGTGNTGAARAPLPARGRRNL